MSSTLLTRIKQNNPGAAVELVENYLKEKALGRIDQHKKIISGDVYGRLMEFVSGEEQPVYMNPNDNAYIEFFKAALAKFGIDNPKSLTDQQSKKNFFDYVDKGWQQMSRTGGAPADGTANTQPGLNIQPGLNPQACQADPNRDPNGQNQNGNPADNDQVGLSTDDPGDDSVDNSDQDFDKSAAQPRQGLPVATNSGFSGSGGGNEDEDGPGNNPDDDSQFQDAPGQDDQGGGQQGPPGKSGAPGSFGGQKNQNSQGDDGNENRNNDGMDDSAFADEDAYSIDPDQFFASLLPGGDGTGGSSQDGGGDENFGHGNDQDGDDQNGDDQDGDNSDDSYYGDDEDDDGNGDGGNNGHDDRDPRDDQNGDQDDDQDQYGDDDDSDDQDDDSDDDDYGNDRNDKKRSNNARNAFHEAIDLIENFIVERNSHFDFIRQGINNHKTLTPDQKKERLQRLDARELTLRKITNRLHHIQKANKSVTDKVLLPNYKDIRNNRELNPQQKKKALQNLNTMTKGHISNGRVMAINLKKLLHKNPVQPVPTVQQPTKSKKTVTKRGRFDGPSGIGNRQQGPRKAKAG
jgi:hypothetical protein